MRTLVNTVFVIIISYIFIGCQVKPPPVKRSSDRVIVLLNPEYINYSVLTMQISVVNNNSMPLIIPGWQHRLVEDNFSVTLSGTGNNIAQKQLGPAVYRSLDWPLADNVIAPGETKVYTCSYQVDVSPGDYDLRVVINNAPDLLVKDCKVKVMPGYIKVEIRK